MLTNSDISKFVIMSDFIIIYLTKIIDINHNLCYTHFEIEADHLRTVTNRK
jgi:hypothetical protein